MNLLIKTMLLSFLFLLLSCDNTEKEAIKEKSHKSKNEEYEFQINSFEEGGGQFISYFKNGQIKEITHWRNDTIPINERSVFYSNGNLREYSFFNLIGEKRYARLYDENGGLIYEIGDFLSHDILSSQKIKLGDSVIVDIYIASPPNSRFEVFGIDTDGRYILENYSKVNYVHQSILTPSKRGSFVFVYEVDCIDNFNQKTESRRSEISFIVE